MINRAISLAILVIYPLLGTAFAAAFIPDMNTLGLFWIGMIYGYIGIMAPLHVKALTKVSMQPISTGLILGGLATIMVMQGFFMINDASPISIFFSLLITLGVIIYLAYKKVHKPTPSATTLLEE